jgi:dTDP-glucose 4,6-dehydratase
VLDRGVIGETYLLGASNEISNLNLVRDILQIMGLGEDFIEFVEDRPGHDRRYAINASKAIKTLGWAPDNSRFSSQLESTVKSYLISVS